MSTTFTFKKIKFLAIGIIFLMLSTTTFASKIYEGYVVKNNEDRVLGKIEMLNPALNEIRIKFIDTHQKKKLFKAKEVKEYGFSVEKWNKKTRQFETKNIVYTRKQVLRSPVPFGPKEVLLEREVGGKVSLYHHFIQQNTSTKNPFLHIMYIQKECNGEMMEVNKSNYRKMLRKIVADHPELPAKIGKKGYGFSYLSKTLATYNHWKLNNTEEVIGMK